MHIGCAVYKEHILGICAKVSKLGSLGCQVNQVKAIVSEPVRYNEKVFQRLRLTNH